MRIGIFAKTFIRPTLEETLDAVKLYGLGCVQFNMVCAGLPSMPDRINVEHCDAICREMSSRDIKMAAVSGTFNMIHPDIQSRLTGLRRLRELASVCKRLGTSVITLCTGTRDPENMWRRHPENDSPQAWKDLIASMSEALQIAEEHDVTLGFEPEVSNAVDSARKGRHLLDEMQSPHLKVVMDAANIFHTGELPRMREILDEAFDILAEDIVIAHAKDLSRDGEAGDVAAGRGVLDYDYYLSLLHKTGFDGPLILHGLTEAEVQESVDFLRGKLQGVDKN